MYHYNLISIGTVLVFFTVANWGIPLAAMADMKRSPEIISPRMTAGMYGIEWDERKKYVFFTPYFPSSVIV